jgi:deoxyribose-phosphate aldolase
MNIDFAFNSTDVNDVDCKNLAKKISEIPIVTSITAPHYICKNIKNLLPNNLILSCFIDYPLGISDLKTRQFSIKESIKLNVSCVDIVMPQNLAANRKYDKIRDDVKSAIDICGENNIKLRYILEYRIFDQYCLKKICEIFDNFGYINGVFTSSGYFLDNLADNILASVFLYENSKNLDIFCTGNAWTKKHFDILIKANIQNFRLNSIHSLSCLLSLINYS